MAPWLEPEPVAADAGLAELAGHPLLAEILVRRGVGQAEQARSFIAATETPAAGDLPGIEAAARAVLAARRICVWGDFDVDGQSATALLVAGLRRLRLDVTYYVPQRNEEGHGLSVAGLRTVSEQGVDLVVTCDCGLSDIAEVEAAGRLGMGVVITDHHVPPAQLPAAVAAVYTAALPPEHPMAHLCGVGVAYALLQTLYGMKGRQGEEQAFLDLVALGTIGDLVPLVGNNRAWVRRGLERLLYKPRVGIAALFKQTGFLLPELPESDLVSYALAPRLNAAGRLAHARTGVELLLCQQPEAAAHWAAELTALNARRQRLSRRLEADIKSLLDQSPQLNEAAALILQGADWSPGVTGIVASRLARRHNKPVVLVSLLGDGMARASIRSVPGIDVQRIVEGQQDLIERFGGHSMAAGFSIRTTLLDQFKGRFLAAIDAGRNQVAPQKTRLDAWTSIGLLNADLARRLHTLGPFGSGNPMPVLGLRDVSLVNVQGLSRHGGDARMLVEGDDGEQLSAVWWGRRPAAVPAGRLDIAYRLRLNPRTPGEEIQLDIIDSRPRPQPLAPVVRVLPYEVEDLRASPQPHEVLVELQRSQGHQVQIWAEGRDARQVAGSRRRDQLEPGPSLVLWNSPPAPQVLAFALERVRPERVFLLAADPGADAPGSFLKGLIRLVRAVVSRQGGKAGLTALAGRLAQRESTLVAGLDYLAQADRLDYRQAGNDLIFKLTVPTQSIAAPMDTLKHLLQETAAYRRYWRRGDAHRLLTVVGQETLADQN